MPMSSPPAAGNFLTILLRSRDVFIHSKMNDASISNGLTTQALNQTAIGPTVPADGLNGSAYGRWLLHASSPINDTSNIFGQNVLTPKPRRCVQDSSDEG
ncbi:hypothetical protein OUZ56_033818 [Daphnia magna]|uniref:Uncharacterized protein n=1 Tax=Daphnia magna TaxID=35525 RepID=A0ABR0BB58_9CRUS|nr:hypothetical protein OUZ56_033818 [Daphnia magna]